MMPVPDVKDDADVRTAVLREGDGFRQVPDERIRWRTVGSGRSELLHAEELDSETHVRFLEDLGNPGQAVARDLALFVFWQWAARRKDDHHFLATDRRRKRRIICQLSERRLK